MLLCRTNRCFKRLGWLEESSNYLVAPVGIILWAFFNLPQEGRMHLEMLLWNSEKTEVFCGMGWCLSKQVGSLPNVVFCYLLPLAGAGSSLHIMTIIDFFFIWLLVPQGSGTKHKVGKTGFVEQRSFFNIFRSFDRLWIGHILVLQVSTFDSLFTNPLLEFAFYYMLNCSSLLGVVSSMDWTRCLPCAQ
jgi:hypothetical protein